MAEFSSLLCDFLELIRWKIGQEVKRPLVLLGAGRRHRERHTGTEAQRKRKNESAYRLRLERPAVPEDRIVSHLLKEL